MGSRKQALQYVTKEESREQGPFYHGVSSGDIARIVNKSSSSTEKRLKSIREDLLNGKSELDVANEDFDLWVRYHRAFKIYKTMVTTPRNWEVKVIVLWGPTGTGKSRWAMERHPEGYWKQRSNWWDGYEGQETIIIDEFYGWLPFDLLLRLCDRYPLLLETKGGQVQCVCKTVIITSNTLPSKWYKSTIYFDSFVRRVDKWIVCKEEFIELNDYGQFCLLT